MVGAPIGTGSGAIESRRGSDDTRDDIGRGDSATGFSGHLSAPSLLPGQVNGVDSVVRRETKIVIWFSPARLEGEIQPRRPCCTHASTPPGYERRMPVPQTTVSYIQQTITWVGSGFYSTILHNYG